MLVGPLSRRGARPLLVGAAVAALLAALGCTDSAGYGSPDGAVANGPDRAELDPDGAGPPPPR